MIKLSTEVQAPISPVQLRLSDRILMLGSCFSTEIGVRLSAAGFDVCPGPFGTLYNPLSILAAMERIASGEPFSREDCEQMGAGAGLVCSFSHHTSYAKPTEEEFLEGTNKALEDAHRFWMECNKVIITLGTACVWEHDGKVVSNCLKRPSVEFTRRRISVEECSKAIESIQSLCEGREIIFTVSPIRHLSDGAHENQLSKSTLLLSLDKALGPRSAYFPSYETVLDELRDYRFYGEDLCHPSKTAVEVVWEKFVDSVDAPEKARISENEKASRRAAHRPLR